MAPTYHHHHLLTKRASLDMSAQPLGKAMIGAIAGGATFLVLFMIGLGVFIYFYYKSAGRPNSTPIGRHASHKTPSSEEDVMAAAEEKTIDSDMSSAAPSPSLASPSTVGAPSAPPVQLKFVIDTPPHSAAPSPDPNAVAVAAKTHERRALPKGGDPWNRQSLASNNSLDSGVPAMPGNEFV